MALQFIRNDSVPNYICESTDISSTTLTGVGILGYTVLATDTGDWYIVTALDTVAAYAIPATFSGTLSVGTVDIDQTTPGTTNGVAAGVSATGSDGIGNHLAVLKAPGSVNSAPLSVIPLVFNGTTFDRLRGSATSGVLIGRASEEVTPVAQASTASLVLVVGSTLDLLNKSSLSYTIENTGLQSIDWAVYGGNASDLSDAVAVNTPATILTTAFDSYAVAVAPYRYYGVFIEDTVGGLHGEATVIGIAKG